MKEVSGESSRIDEELVHVGRLNFRTDALEDAYQNQFTESNLYRHRIALIIAVIAIFVFLIEDLANFPEQSIQSYLIIRLGITLPFFVLAYAMTRLPSMRRHTQHWLLAGLIIFGIGSIAILAVNFAHGHVSPYEGLILMIIGAYFLVGIDFRTASIATIVVCVCYLFFALAQMKDVPGISYNIAFLLATAVFCAAGGYGVEKQLRINFLNARKLSLLSETDGLTGLLNRTAMEIKMNQAIQLTAREQQGVLFCFIDVDCFKNYNDHYGHQAGDAVLQAVGAALQRCCKRPLDFAARYGGEEFALVWYPTKQNSIDALMSAVSDEIAALNIPHEMSTVSDRLTVSGGVIYIEPDRNTSNESLIKAADEALYRAKKAGRNQFVVTEAHDVAAQSLA